MYTIFVCVYFFQFDPKRPTHSTLRGPLSSFLRRYVSLLSKTFVWRLTIEFTFKRHSRTRHTVFILRVRDKEVTISLQTVPELYEVRAGVEDLDY